MAQNLIVSEIRGCSSARFEFALVYRKYAGDTPSV